MQALAAVKDPNTGKDFVSTKVLKNLQVNEDGVAFDVELGYPAKSQIPGLRSALIAAAKAVPGVQNVSANLYSKIVAHAAQRGVALLPNVKNIVAVASGKGGVGKSTTAVNLALALAAEGASVGLLDADIYGPSLPILLGIEDGAARARMTPEKHIVPLVAHGLPMISFGFFLGEASPAIWRGPMVSKAVKQFARGVAWPELDVLVVDLPPGTGDVPLSLAQAVELSGAIVVTQPPRVAAAEALKAARMFASLDVPVLGVVENMSGPFGHGAGIAIASELGIPFLGEVPFDEAIVHDGDAGVPTMVARTASLAARRFDRVAERVAEALGWSRLEPAA
jgi:ATP-binding protein involved in chromosome partitioning